MIEANEREEMSAWLREVVEDLRRPVPRPDGAVERIVRRAVGGATEKARPRPIWMDRMWAWLCQPRFALSPLSAVGWATALALVVLFGGRILLAGDGQRDAPTGVYRHQFVLVAPAAESVSLVGDFNGWDVGATPLVRRGNVWTVEVPLDPGRHVYSFVVDGREWVPDASAPRAPDDEFGRPSSVLMLERKDT